MKIKDELKAAKTFPKRDDVTFRKSNLDINVSHSGHPKQR